MEGVEGVEDVWGVRDEGEANGVLAKRTRTQGPSGKTSHKDRRGGRKLLHLVIGNAPLCNFPNAALSKELTEALIHPAPRCGAEPSGVPLPYHLE